MISNRDHYKLLANLFRYPENETYVSGVMECLEMIRQNYPDQYLKVGPFANFIRNNDMHKIEETFNLTFHIQAICYLDLGYVLFGEDYKRGEFLVNMKREHEKIGHDYGCELADNLPSVLQFMAISEDNTFINELAVRIVIPALEKMTKEFDMARIALRQKIYKKKERVVLDKDMELGNIYGVPMQILFEILQGDFAGISFNTNDFVPEYGRNLLLNCGSCSTHTNQSPTTLSH